MFFKGDILKRYDEDPVHLHFICSGTVGVYDYKIVDNPTTGMLDKLGGSRKGSTDIGEGKGEFDKLSDQMEQMIMIN